MTGTRHPRRARAPRLLAVALLAAAGCRPAPREEGSGAATPRARPAASGVPPGMLVVPEDPVEAYRALRGEGETPRAGGRILRHLESDLRSLNPVLRTTKYETYVARYLFDPLLAYDQRRELVPVLAESWEMSPDRLATTLKLRRGASWHDGRPVTAGDVCFTARMVLDDRVPAINVRASLYPLSGCEAPDDHTAVLRWKSPYSAALAAVAELVPVPEHVYRVEDPARFAAQPANRAPVGSGPWRFVSWESQARVVLRRNDDYWGERPRPDETVFKVIDNRETALKACQAGELDEQYVPHPKWVSEVASPAFAGFHKAIHYTYSFNYYGLNHRDPLFADRRVRRALVHASDRPTVIRELYGGLAKEISGPFHSGTEWYDRSVAPWPYDLDLAARLLEEAGWKDADGDGWLDREGRPFRFELLYPAGNTVSEQVGAITQQSYRRLGIDMTLRALEGATFFERVNRGEFTACTLAWEGDPDPESLIVLFDSRQAPPTGVNHFFYANPEVDRLIDAQRAEFDHDRRVELVHRIHRLLHEDAPVVFQLSRPQARIFRDTIRGIHMSTYDPFLVRPGGELFWLVGGRGDAAP